MRLARLTALAVCAATAVRAGHSGGRSSGISRPEGVGDSKGGRRRTGDLSFRKRASAGTDWDSVRTSDTFEAFALGATVGTLEDRDREYYHSAERMRDYEAEKQVCWFEADGTLSVSLAKDGVSVDKPAGVSYYYFLCDGECCDVDCCHFSWYSGLYYVCIVGILSCMCWGSYERYCKTRVANWRWRRNAENAAQYGGYAAAERPAYAQQQAQWPSAAGQPAYAQQQAHWQPAAGQPQYEPYAAGPGAAGQTIPPPPV